MKPVLERAKLKPMMEGQHTLFFTPIFHSAKISDVPEFLNESSFIYVIFEWSCSHCYHFSYGESIPYTFS